MKEKPMRTTRSAVSFLALASLCTAVWCSPVAAQTVLRMGTQYPVKSTAVIAVWTLEVSLFCFVWLMWVGAIGCIREERQIRIDFVEKYAPMALRRILVPATTLLSMAFLVLVIYYGVYVAESQR
jgi:TRAP-type C4-dicarboxylate transport system permease small subunit